MMTPPHGLVAFALGQVNDATGDATTPGHAIDSVAPTGASPAVPAAEPLAAAPGQWLGAAFEITAYGMVTIIAVMAFFALLITLLGRVFPEKEGV